MVLTGSTSEYKAIQNTAHGINNKVDKILGKGLSTEDYTTTEKNKLAGIDVGANKYIHPNSHPYSMITGVPEFVNAIAIGSTSDPNTTQEPYILTNHVNSPGLGLYWHIQTLFYSNKTGNRSQIATSYNNSTNHMYIRSLFNSTWTSWKKIYHQDNLAKADIGLGSVLNYGIATTAEAQAGTSNVKYMTPLRVKEAITQEGAIKYAAGAYIGSGVSNRTINLGLQPKKLTIHAYTSSYEARGTMHYINNSYGESYSYNNGVALRVNNNHIEISGNSLILLSSSFGSYNQNGVNYIWEAWH